MRRPLLPRHDDLLPLLGTGAEHLLAGVQLLPQCLGAGVGGGEEDAGSDSGSGSGSARTDVDVLAAAATEALRGLERTAGDTTAEVARRINASLVLPWGRGDTHALALALHGCLGHLVAAADLVERCAITDLPLAALDLVAVLHRQAELTVAAVPRLTSARDLADFWVEVDRLHRHAATLHRSALAALIAGGDVLAVLAVREVLVELLAAARAFADIAHHVERLALEGV